MWIHLYRLLCLCQTQNFHYKFSESFIKTKILTVMCPHHHISPWVGILQTSWLSYDPSFYLSDLVSVFEQNEKMIWILELFCPIFLFILYLVLWFITWKSVEDLWMQIITLPSTSRQCSSFNWCVWKEFGLNYMTVKSVYQHNYVYKLFYIWFYHAYTWHVHENISIVHVHKSTLWCLHWH